MYFILYKVLYISVYYIIHIKPEKTKFRGIISSGIWSMMNPTMEEIRRELNKTFKSVSEN